MPARPPPTSTPSTPSSRRPGPGVIGFKAFMSDTGVDDFTAVDDLTLYEAMVAVAGLAAPVPVAVHAESNTITRRLAQRALAAGRTATRDYLDSRPARAETEAI